MITDRASTIKEEVLQLIDLQIETLKQDSRLDSSQLQDYRVRSERIRQLYAALDRIGKARTTVTQCHHATVSRDGDAATSIG